MKTSQMNLVLCLLLLQLSNVYAQYEIETVNGGFRKRISYDYQFKDGKLDTNSKRKVDERKYNKAGKMIEELYYDTTGFLSFKRTDIFDNKSNRTEVDESRYMMKKEISKMKIIVFKYDKNNRVVEELWYVYPDGTYNNKENYSYDSRGNRIEHKVFDSLGSMLWYEQYEFDDMGNKTKEVSYGNNGTIKDLFIYNYNSKNKLTEVLRKTGKDTAYNKSKVYKYDSKGNKVELHKYVLDGYDDGRILYKYDNHNNCIQEDYYFYDKLIYKFMYKYDIHSNMIEKIKFNKLDEPLQKTIFNYSK